MTGSFDQFRARFDEQACFGLMMQARHGGPDLACPACGRRSVFKPNVKHRAYSCTGCGHSIYPCAGTPLSALRTPLTHYLFAIGSLAASGTDRIANRLEREANVPRATARRIERDVRALAGDDPAAWPQWLREIGRQVAGSGPGNGQPVAKGPPPSRKSLPALAGGPPPPERVPPAAGRVREERKPAIRHETPRNKGSEPGAADAKRHEAPTSAPPQPSRLSPIVGGAVLVGLFLAGGIAFAIWSTGPSGRTDATLPELSQARAQPSLILSAVEADLEAARAAVEFALENESQGDVPDQPGEPGSETTIPPRILIPSVRLPQGPTSAQRQPSKPADPGPSSGPAMVATGDPNQILTFGPIKIRRHLVDTIVRASRVVGADPSLLMAVADKESSFATEVKAKTSSATGLFQFIESTWLGVLHQYGAKHGIREYAKVTKAGRSYVVADPAERERILDLRREPYVSALLAGEMLKRDTLRLEKSLGRHLTGGEIYLIHFLGPDAAETFIDKVDDQPNLAAAELLPRPAQANRPIFYSNAGGQTKTLTVSEVHRKFDDMIKVRLDRYKIVKGAPPAVSPKP